MNNKILTVIGFSLMLYAMGASAAFVLDTTGAKNSEGKSVQNGTLTLANEGIIPNSSYGNGWIGANVSWSGALPTSWSLQYLGKEATWNNLFQFTDGNGGWKTVFANKDFKHGSDLSAPQAFATSLVNNFGFRFVIDNKMNNTTTNASNSVGAPSFFAAIEPTGSLILWLDDSGNSNDRDFSDMGIRITAITAVPIPAALWLFLSGLIGIGAAIGRRRALHR